MFQKVHLTLKTSFVIIQFQFFNISIIQLFNISEAKFIIELSQFDLNDAMSADVDIQSFTFL